MAIERSEFEIGIKTTANLSGAQACGAALDANSEKAKELADNLKQAGEATPTDASGPKALSESLDEAARAAEQIGAGLAEAGQADFDTSGTKELSDSLHEVVKSAESFDEALSNIGDLGSFDSTGIVGLGAALETVSEQAEEASKGLNDVSSASVVDAGPMQELGEALDENTQKAKVLEESAKAMRRAIAAQYLKDSEDLFGPVATGTYKYDSQGVAKWVESLSNGTAAADKAGGAMGKLGEGIKEADHHVELFTTHGRAFHKLLHESNDLIPGLSYALRAAFHPTALGMYAMVGVLSSFIAAEEEAKKKTEELNAAMKSGQDVAGFGNGMRELQHEFLNSVVAGEEFVRKLTEIATAQQSIKEATDATILSIGQEVEADNRSAEARKKLAVSQIKSDAASGRITKEQEIAALAELESKASEDKQKRSKTARDAELAAREAEYQQTLAAAKKIRAELPAAEDKALRLELMPRHLDKAEKVIADYIRAAQERIQRLTETLGEPGWYNKKTPWADQLRTDKFPIGGERSEEWARGQAQIESDKKAIEQYKRNQALIGSDDFYLQIMRDKAAAVADYDRKKKEAETLTKRQHDLEQEIAAKRQENALLDVSDQEVSVLESQRTKVDRDAAIAAERAREKKRIEELRSKSERSESEQSEIDSYDAQEQRRLNPPRQSQSPLPDRGKSMTWRDSLVKDIASLGNMVDHEMTGPEANREVWSRQIMQTKQSIERYINTMTAQSQQKTEVLEMIEKLVNVYTHNQVDINDLRVKVNQLDSQRRTTRDL